jgi:hypothetical protein
MRFCFIRFICRYAFHSLIMAWSLQGCVSIRLPHQTVPPEEFQRYYPKNLLVADLDTMMHCIEEAHPNPYYFTEKQHITALRDSIVRVLPDSLQRLPFSMYVRRLASSYNDGHLAASIDEEYSEFINKGGKIFPFSLSAEQGRLSVRKVFSTQSTIQLLHTITRINGLSADSLLDVFTKEESGERFSHRQKRALNNFAQHLWTHGVFTPFNIQYREKIDSPEQTSQMAGMTWQEIKAQGRTLSEEQSSAFYRYTLLPEKIGLMEWFTMYDDKQKFNAFLEQTFRSLQQDSAKGLIIDVRRNRGGSSGYGEQLLDYITEKPYKIGGRKEWKTSMQYKRFVDGLYAQVPWTLRWIPFHWFIPTLEMLRFHAERPVGLIDTTNNSELHRPKPNALRFRGPVYMLMGTDTFSSGMLLTDAVSTYDICPLLGEETGELANSFGEVCFFDTPNTKILVSVSTARFTRNNGDVNDKRGVMPTFEVKQKPEDTVKGVDTVMEEAKSRIFKEQHQ